MGSGAPPGTGIRPDAPRDHRFCRPAGPSGYAGDIPEHQECRANVGCVLSGRHSGKLADRTVGKRLFDAVLRLGIDLPGLLLHISGKTARTAGGRGLGGLSKGGLGDDEVAFWPRGRAGRRYNSFAALPLSGVSRRQPLNPVHGYDGAPSPFDASVVGST